MIYLIIKGYNIDETCYLKDCTHVVVVDNLVPAFMTKEEYEKQEREMEKEIEKNSLSDDEWFRLDHSK